MSPHDICGKIWNSPHLACVWCRKRRHICKIYAIFLKKISFVKIYALCREIHFVAIYAFLCGEKFIQNFSLWIYPKLFFAAATASRHNYQNNCSVIRIGITILILVQMLLFWGQFWGNPDKTGPSPVSAPRTCILVLPVTAQEGGGQIGQPPPPHSRWSLLHGDWEEEVSCFLVGNN